MSGFSDLPKFPKDEAVDLERIHDQLRYRPEPPERLADRIRHAWPAFLLSGFACLLILGLVLFTQVINVYVGCGGIIGIPLATYVVWRVLRGYTPS